LSVRAFDLWLLLSTYDDPRNAMQCPAAAAGGPSCFDSVCEPPPRCCCCQERGGADVCAPHLAVSEGRKNRRRRTNQSRRHDLNLCVPRSGVAWSTASRCKIIYLFILGIHFSTDPSGRYVLRRGLRLEPNKQRSQTCESQLHMSDSS
jgi:hypothetical protein